MADPIQRLTEIKQHLDQQKTKKAQAEGALNNFMKELKDTFKCSTVAQAKIKLKVLTEDSEDLQEQTNTQIDKMEKRYA